MDITERIAQWQKMTEADPSNDMGWFSLGEAYMDDQQYDSAQAAFAKAAEINPAMTQAIAKRGYALLQLDRNDEAVAIMTEGYQLAAQRGDVKPQKAMASMLVKLGVTLPDVERIQTGGSTPPADQIIDRRTGRPGTRMTEPPMRGTLGEFIATHYSEETWREWIGMGTKVINEFRLDFSKESDQKVYDQQMMLWLGFTEDEVKP